MKISACSLGDDSFKNDYNLKYAYLAGGMYRGVASTKLVIRMGKAGMLAFFGAGGLKKEDVKDAIICIQNELQSGEPYGMNLVHNPSHPEKENEMVELFLEYGIENIEAAAFMGITKALIKYRAHGLSRNHNGDVIASNRIIAKISRPEIAELFLSPAPERHVKKMIIEGQLTEVQAELLKEVPMATDLCVEADSGGHTDCGVAYALTPAMIKLRNDMMQKYKYLNKVRVGAAGGIGSPEAVAAAFVMGADFIVTGSVNQCTIEAKTSDMVKDLLQQINVQDTEYAPAGDMFELGARVQVVKKGLLFPARANKLFDLYRQFNSLDEIDDKTKMQLQNNYFKRSFSEIYDEVKQYCSFKDINKADQNPKMKMALIFRWYFGYSSYLALSGIEDGKVNFQIHCGPALGVFNQLVKGTNLENWRNRHVDEIGKKLMMDCAELLNRWRV